MAVSSVSCTCTTDDSIALCEYSIEGSSEKGSTKYDFVSCDAAVCDEEVTEEGGFTKVCKEPEGWKDSEGFDLTTFDEAVFEPWCVDPTTLDDNGSRGLGSYLHFIFVAAGLVLGAI